MRHDNYQIGNVTAITVTYNSADIAYALGLKLAKFANVIVVDNSSRDACVQIIRNEIPHALIIENIKNVGFGAANNIAMQHVSTEFALLINPDAEIESEDVEILVRTMQRYPNAGIVAPQGWNGAQVAQPSYREAFYEDAKRLAYKIPDATCSAKWLHGCCLLVRTSVFKQIRGFDENFFLYYEDDDLCLRTLSQGYDCILEPTAKVVHLGASSSHPSWRIDFKKHFYFCRSRHYIIGKYISKNAALLYLTKILIAAPFGVVLYAMAFQRKHAVKWAAWGCATWSLLLNIKSKERPK